MNQGQRIKTTVYNVARKADVNKETSVLLHWVEKPVLVLPIFM